MPRFEGLEEYVFSCFEKMYTAFESQAHLLDPSRIHEVRYEDLVRDPVGEMRRLYEHLDLGEFDLLQPRLDAYLKQNDGYRTNTYEVDPELCRQHRRALGAIHAPLRLLPGRARSGPRKRLSMRPNAPHRQCWRPSATASLSRGLGLPDLRDRLPLS